MEAIFANETVKIKCSHCGGSIGEGWEDNCNRGNIYLSISSIALDYLWGEDHHKEGYDFDHPAMSGKNDFQNLQFTWDNNGKYRICRKCQCELIGVIGKFFKADKCYNKGE